jgi:NitT/TauT family transport system permease protein
MSTSGGKLVPAVPPRPRRRLRSWADAHAGLLSFLALMAVLELVIYAWHIPDYILPAPHAVVAALIAGFAQPLGASGGFYVNIGTTLCEALAAFVIGSLLGVAMGAAVVEYRVARKLILPYVIGLQSVPKVALAPLFVVWFGLGISSKIVLGVLLTLFPLLVNTAAGLASVDKNRIELMTSLNASGWKTFRLVRLPSALPFIFAGLEMAAVYAILGAVVGEFVGGQSGLGVLILNRNAALDIAGSISALVVLGVMGVVLQKLVAAVKVRLLFWAPSHDALRFEERSDPA